MCGIYGTLNRTIKLDNVIPFLRHRGPDAQTTWSEGNVQFHHFRLSILDLVGGVQPMHRNNLVVTFNGELYNHLDVRAKHNLVCETNSDTETLLAAFEKLGPACLDDFDGMFAFAIYDKQAKKIFLARDRAGKKPLYIYHQDNQLVFASELRAMSKTLDLRPNMNAIDLFIKGAFIGSETAYRNVRELQGGEYAIIDTETAKIEFHKWWSIDSHYDSAQNDDFNTAEEKTKQFIRNGVRRRIDSSDLEVGAFLSGGIDSGLVVAAASDISSNLKTFTVSMPGAYNEADLAKLVAQKYNTNHTEININFNNLKDDIFKIVTNYGEPFFDSSAIPSYYVSQEAKKHVTVILNGDGADELYAGYRRYVPSSKIDFYNQKSSAIWRMLKRMLPIAHEKKSKYNYLYRLVSTLSQKSPADVYWSLTTDVFQSNPEAYINPNITNDTFINEFVKKHKNWNGLHKQMGLDFYILLQGILLKKMDIATMAHSLEGRSPFLCKEILEYTPGMNKNFKIKGKTTKHILRNIAKDWLPPTLFTQPKRGFEIPLKSWMNNELKELLFSYLNKENTFVNSFVKQKFVKGLLEKKINVSEEKRAKMLYQLMVTEMWASDNGFS